MKGKPDRQHDLFFQNQNPQQKSEGSNISTNPYEPVKTWYNPRTASYSPASSPFADAGDAAAFARTEGLIGGSPVHSESSTQPTHSRLRLQLFLRLAGARPVPGAALVMRPFHHFL
jgi:hypothetical protein